MFASLIFLRSVRRTLIAVGVCFGGSTSVWAQNDIAGVRSERIQLENDPKRTFFFLPAQKRLDEQGNGLLLILPGGNGSEDFLPFVKRIRQHAVPDGIHVAQLVAPQWTATQQIVWPTASTSVERQEFTTEEFAIGVIRFLTSKHKIDPARIFCFGWSSSGPAVYSLALQQKTPIAGVYISMSVFHPDRLPSLSHGKGRPFYIEHAPDDRVCPFWMAQQASGQLRQQEAIVHFEKVAGGHGWHGDVYERIRTALDWLETHK